MPITRALTIYPLQNYVRLRNKQIALDRHYALTSEQSTDKISEFFSESLFNPIVDLLVFISNKFQLIKRIFLFVHANTSTNESLCQNIDS